MNDAWDQSTDGRDDDFQALTPQQAEALRAHLPKFSAWTLVGWQALAGMIVLALAWTLTRRAEVAWSALWGAAAAVIPQAIVARGMSRGTGGQLGVAVIGFAVWEAAKVAAALAMLAAAPRVVPGLSWPAMLVAMIVCMKVQWWVLLRLPRAKLG